MEEVKDYSDVLSAIDRWPLAVRLALIQDVLKNLEWEIASSGQRARQATLERALGLLAGEGPVLSDAEVKRMLHEHRAEKYG